jgi:hypothetical protein
VKDKRAYARRIEQQPWPSRTRGIEEAKVVARQRDPRMPGDSMMVRSRRALLNRRGLLLIGAQKRHLASLPWFVSMKTLIGSSTQSSEKRCKAIFLEMGRLVRN